MHGRYDPVDCSVDGVAHAKGPTLRIVIRDTAGAAVIEIRDRSVLDQFNVWDGRGTFSGAPGHELEASQGFIIDWQAGAADSRPGQLRRYEVRFFVGQRIRPQKSSHTSSSMRMILRRGRVTCTYPERQTNISVSTCGRSIVAMVLRDIGSTQAAPGKWW